MARIIPSDYRKIKLSGNNSLELDTLDYLKKNLSDEYTVFHNVYWTRTKERSISYGEIDFVILNTSGDLVVIEQKNDQLLEKDGQLLIEYSDNVKNVGNQLHRNVDNLKEKFGKRFGKGINLKVEYLIYCPDYTVRNVSALTLDKNRIVDGASKQELSSYIERLIGSGTSTINKLHEQLFDYLCQRYEFYPIISKYISSQNQEFSRLSGGLIDVINNIEMNPFRICIEGSAGSGKSVIAANLFKQYRNKDKKVLYVCYNRPLKEQFSEQFPDDKNIHTWNGLCDVFLKEQGEQLNYNEMKSNPKYWEEVHNQVISFDVPEKWLFDVVIVDEGQDFESDWFEILKLFCKPDYDMIWLEDSDQNVRDTGFTNDDFPMIYHAHQNYRTPYKIASFINHVLPFEVNGMNELPGRDVIISEYNVPEDQVKIVEKEVTRLLNEGFEQNEIVILTTHGITNSILSSINSLGKYQLCHYTGDYDMNGKQVYTDGHIYFESIGRFKGQQAPAVILIDVDPNGEYSVNNNAYKFLYTGMTRATVKLVVVASKSNKYTKKLCKYV